jgi:Xaa-Pro aminopeptidase
MLLKKSPTIPDVEFAARIERARELIIEAGLDALLVTSHEADFANVRYFSDYWTLFEIAGVLIPAAGPPALLIGPESETYAQDRSKIANIHKLVEYRESADPAYPGVAVSSFRDVFESCGLNNPQRIGLGGYLVTPAPLVSSLRNAFPQAELIPADDIMVKMRAHKSENELACLRRAFEISELAVEAVLNEMRAGMTEQQVVGLAQRIMYEQGAEYEGHPTYVLSGRNSRHAISRPTAKPIEAGELIQLNIGARISGYSSSVGLPVCIGTMSDEMRDLVEFGLEAHAQTIQWMTPGTPAREVATQYRQLFTERGYEKNFLYGPCHGIGMMEVERPWLEETSDYFLEPNMTFQIDTFLYNDQFGLRWENGGVVGQESFEMLSSKYRRVIEL